MIEWQTAPITLIGHGRVVKTVADDPSPPVERGPDRARDMIAPRRVKQQHFADCVPLIVVTAEEQPPDRLGARRAAGFARRYCGNAGTLQSFDEQPHLSGFACPLPAFDGDKATARAQCRLPQIK